MPALRGAPGGHRGPSGQRGGRTGDRGGARDVRPGEARGGRRLRGRPRGPHDAALLFNLIHHFTPEDNVRLFKRIHEALKPGGTFAVLDLFMPPKQKRPPDSAAFLGLFFFLTSAAGTYSPEQLRDWLVEAGFEEPRRVRIRRIPSQTLYEARKP